jgi:hypothetical protein
MSGGVISGLGYLIPQLFTAAANQVVSRFFFAITNGLRYLGYKTPANFIFTIVFYAMR